MTVGLDANQANPDTTVNQMVQGHTTKSVAGASDVTLTDYEATWAILECTGALTGNINVIYPQVDNKMIVYNNTSGSFTLTVKMVTGVTIIIAQGTSSYLYSDATDIKEVIQGVATSGFTMSGDINMQDNVIIRAELKDYSETAVSIAASAIDLSLGNYQYKTISGATTFTITNPSPTTKACGFTLELTNAGTNITWPTSVKWPSGTAPTLTTSGVDLLTFTTRDAGTTWYGALAMEDMQ